MVLLPSEGTDRFSDEKLKMLYLETYSELYKLLQLHVYQKFYSWSIGDGFKVIRSLLLSFFAYFESNPPPYPRLAPPLQYEILGILLNFAARQKLASEYESSDGLLLFSKSLVYVYTTVEKYWKPF